MTMTSEEVGNLWRVPEQTLWRVVHAIGSARALDQQEMAVLRLWAAQRMRDLSYAVFDPVSGTVRDSFNTAIDIAAGQIRAGDVPE